MSKVEVRSSHDPIIIRYLSRVKHRVERHGNWRQVYLDCQGVCQFPLEEGMICGEVEGLEFHEQFGEAKSGEAKPQQRVLLCNYHHWSVHGERWVNKRHYPSMLQTDVEIEIKLCGSLVDWIAHYHLKERRVEYDFTNDSQEDKTDLNYSEDS